MARLSELVAELTSLIEAGRTPDTMERFYANDVTMPNAARKENEQPPRVGRTACLEHERRMLECWRAGVSAMKATLLSQAIHNETSVVFSEWRYVFTDLSGQRFSLTEVSVQHWRDELIYREKFYYNKALTVS